MKRTLVWVVGMVWMMAAAGEDQSCAAVPDGWRAEARAASGSWCADVLVKPEKEGVRKLRVFEGGQKAFESDDAALCKNCGGLLGDPFQGIEWKGQTLAVANAGGSRETWSETWKFAKRGGRWVIAGLERQYVGGESMDSLTESINTLAGKATAALSPGDGSKSKAKKAACARKGNAPDVSAVQALREEPFSCGIKADWAD